MPDDEQAKTRERALRQLRTQKEEVDRICATSSHGSAAMLPEAAAELYNEAVDLLMEAGVDLEPGLRIRADEIQSPPTWDKKGYPGVPAFVLRLRLDRVMRLYGSVGESA